MGGRPSQWEAVFGWYALKLLFKFSFPEQVVREIMPNSKLMISITFIF